MPAKVTTVPATLWKTASRQIGELEDFRSEYEMEAFLWSNQVLLVGTSEDDEGPRRLWSQLPIVKATGERGRIDLVGLVASDANGAWVLRLFELKKSADASAVKQLRDYLDGWNKASQDYKVARDYVKGFISEFVDNAEIDGLLSSLRGTLVASRLEEDALVAALEQPRVALMKLTKFRGSADTSYIVTEDVVGGAPRRTDFSWADDRISENDVLVAQVPRLPVRICARPFGPSVGSPGQRPVPRKRLVLDAESVSEIVKQREEIVRRAGQFAKGYQERLVSGLDDIRDRKDAPLYLQQATAVAFALANYLRQDFWVTPTRYWRLERTGETLWEIESRLKKA